MSSLTACENVELATELVKDPLVAKEVLTKVGLGGIDLIISLLSFLVVNNKG